LADKVHFGDTAAIRAEIAKVIPVYDGIQLLVKKGDAFQYGGEHLCKDGQCLTPDGKAHFHLVGLPQSTVPEGAFRLVTRRGKQFNSMVHEPTDPINGAPRDAVLMCAEDAKRLRLSPNQRIQLSNAFGSLDGRVFIAPVKPGSLQVHWPEGNVLLDPKARSKGAKIPAYKEAHVFIAQKQNQGAAD
jgi:anaerobic selenocysteine-containing dehydrogenase